MKHGLITSGFVATFALACSTAAAIAQPVNFGRSPQQLLSAVSSPLMLVRGSGGGHGSGFSDGHGSAGGHMGFSRGGGRSFAFSGNATIIAAGALWAPVTTVMKAAAGSAAVMAAGSVPIIIDPEERPSPGGSCSLLSLDLGDEAGDRPVGPIGDRRFEQRCDDPERGLGLHR
jgi:hypothetical protein